MKPKTLFVNPPHPYLTNPDAQAPLGLLYVAASVRKAGYPVEFFSMSTVRDVSTVEIPEVDIYAITGTALDLPRIHELAKEIKHRYPKSIVVVGGPISISKEYLDMNLIDVVVNGEGEHVMLKILEQWPDVHQYYVAPRIEDLDALPFPARDLLGGKLGGDVFAGHQRFYGEQSTVISTSRGCPCICTFCASPKIWGRHVVYRSAASVIAEMEHVIRDYGVRQFRFSDDNLTCNIDKLTELCRFLEGREVAWRASIRVLPNSVEMFKMMKAAGCAEVCFGIESGDQDVLRALKKGTSVKDNRTAIMNAKAAGLIVRILFMIGTPGETKQTVQRNIDFFESVKTHYDSIALTNFCPLPGCAIAEDIEQHNCRKHDAWDLASFNVCMFGSEGRNQWKNFIIPNGLTLEELIENKRQMSEYVIKTGYINHG